MAPLRCDQDTERADGGRIWCNAEELGLQGGSAHERGEQGMNEEGVEENAAPGCARYAGRCLEAQAAAHDPDPGDEQRQEYPARIEPDTDAKQ